MKALIVTAEMAEPIVHREDGLHLDGILSWCVFSAMSPEQRAEVPPIGEHAVDFDLPLGRWSVPSFGGHRPDVLDENGAIWGWAASAAEFDTNAIRRMHEIRKRIEAGEMERRSSAKSIETGAGPGKAYNLSMPTVFSRTVRWIAVGDAERVAHLLVEHAPHIGGKGSMGMGRVLRWCVEIGNHTIEDVCARRRMPATSPETAVGFASIRPPYHHASRIVPVGGR